MKRIVEVRGVRIGEGRPKICVPLAEENTEDLLQRAEKLKEYPVDLVEWRIDWYAGLKDKQLVKETTAKIRDILGDLPLLVTLRTKEAGGRADLTPEEYAAINRELAETGLVDLLDVQVYLDVEKAADWIADLQQKGVYVVGSWRRIDGTPNQQEIEERFRRIQACGADILKIVVMPRTSEDVKCLMQATRQMRDSIADRPMIAVSMSGLGVASRIAGEYYGSDVTLGTVGKASAPGQLPVAELKPILEALHDRKKIVLTGFMGSGKTTVGTTLAFGLNCPIYDTDQMIEEEEGVTIKELFADKGEAYFRQRETAMLRRLNSREDMSVIATGGGLPMQEVNHALMKDLGVVIFLKVAKESVVKRLAGDETRPLLTGPDPEKTIEKLLISRTPIYEKAADLIILTDS